MSQMVVPQNLPSSASSEAPNASASSRPDKAKSGDSAFDAVSRSEQNRSAAKEAKAAKKAEQAERNQQSDESDRANRATTASEKRDTGAADRSESRGDKPPASEISAEDSGQNLAAGQPGEPQTSSDLAPLLAPGGKTAPAGETGDTDPGIDGVPLTFAGLQSLAASAQPQGGTSAAGASANGQGLPFLQGSMMSMAGLNGSGKNTAMTLQTSGEKGAGTGMVLTEALLAGVTADGGKGADSPILQTAIRFQGALESANAQANAVNTPKMAPDAPLLRGYTTSIDVPVSHAEWGDKMAGKLTWLTARNMSVAEIHLTPPDMGPMEVKVQVQQDQASITVHSANPAVRDQLELNSHRLRDMLSEQGLSLEQFDVSDSGRDQSPDGEARGSGQSGEGLFADEESDDNVVGAQSLDLSWKGEVDIFA